MARNVLNWLCSLVAAAALAGESHPHKMLLMDESRSRVHYVDLDDASKNWEIIFPKRYRDVQIIGNRRLLVSSDSGFCEYDWDSRKLVAEFRDAKLAGSESVRRLPDGRTIVGCNQRNTDKTTAIVFHELDNANKPLRTATFAGLNTLRLFRLGSKGTLLFGANKTLIIEGDLNGKILRKIEIEDGGHFYEVLEKPDGHWLAAGGYGRFLVELDANGKELKRWGSKPGPTGKGYMFFAGIHPLKDGRIVIANWTGHGAQDSEKGHQVLMFAPDGKLLWSWHDPKLAGTIHRVTVMDNLDVAAPFEERPAGSKDP
jgi:hypothetical protein